MAFVKGSRKSTEGGKRRKTSTGKSSGRVVRKSGIDSIEGGKRRKTSTSRSSGRVVRKSGMDSIEGGKRAKTSTSRSSGRVVRKSGMDHSKAIKTGNVGEDEPIRLNKYLASTGLCSRREADELITAGLVSVNGKLISSLGTKIKPGDVVKYNGETLKEEKKVYILLNKPKDYVTTVEDPHAKRTVLDLVRGACKERIYPVGRLDRNTTGVLLLTNDGELTKRLTHPRFEKLKIYHVHLNKNIRPVDMEKISTGVTLDDGLIKADSISYADPVDKTQIGIELHSGKNHIVRRIFEHLGYEVAKLDRVYFAGLTKKNLPRGEWRFLNEKEIAMLKMNAFK